MGWFILGGIALVIILILVLFEPEGGYPLPFSREDD